MVLRGRRFLVGQFDLAGEERDVVAQLGLLEHVAFARRDVELHQTLERGVDLRALGGRRGRARRQRRVHDSVEPVERYGDLAPEREPRVQVGLRRVEPRIEFDG